MSKGSNSTGRSPEKAKHRSKAPQQSAEFGDLACNPRLVELLKTLEGKGPVKCDKLFFEILNGHENNHCSCECEALQAEDRRREVGLRSGSGGGSGSGGKTVTAAMAVVAIHLHVPTSGAHARSTCRVLDCATCTHVPYVPHAHMHISM